MKKAALSIFLIVLAAHFSLAQTKIFKQVGNEISSEVKTIMQGNTLVGYLVFTQIEQATKDSFNYRIKIMDENLNDIGTVNFRELRLDLQAVSFEQDVLCVAYFKTNLIGYQFKGKEEYKAAFANNQTAIYTQFIGLDGKIIKSNSISVNINIQIQAQSYGELFSGKREPWGHLAHDIQLSNISQRGFACFYGEEDHNFLLVFNPKGELLWRKEVDNNFDGYYMLTSRGDVYFLCRSDDYKHTTTSWHSGTGRIDEPNHSYRVLGYSTSDTTSLLDYVVVDLQASRITLISFENDPSTGRPYMAGLLLKPKQEGCIGLYSIAINGVSKQAVKPVFTYWNNNPLDSTTDTHLFEKQIKTTKIAFGFKGFNGLTYFTGASRVDGAELIKQNVQGTISIERNVLDEKIRVYSPGPGSPMFGDSFYRLVNSETKTDYLVADTPPVIAIYDVTHKKIVHTIPRKEAGITTSVLPAKEGYIMVSEYNKKEKYTKVSIEAL